MGITTKAKHLDAADEMLEAIWSNASVNVPFASKSRRDPFLPPRRLPIIMSEAQELFDSFDENLNGTMQAEEAQLMLESLGMDKDRVASMIQLMFKYDDELTWDKFRLWVKRDKFFMRDVGLIERIYITLEEPNHSKLARYWACFMVSCILLSVSAYMVESWPDLRYTPCTGCEPVLKDPKRFGDVELFVIVVFTIDYLGRFATVHAARHFKYDGFDVIQYFLSFDVLNDTQRFAKRAEDAKAALEDAPIRHMINWIFQPLNVIDFFSVLPYYCEGLIVSNAGAESSNQVLRVLRLCRLFRLMKLQKYNNDLNVFLQTIVDSSAAIGWVVVLATPRILFSRLITCFV
jgi:hypothetical protein